LTNYSPQGPYKFFLRRDMSLEKMMLTNYPRLRKDFKKLEKKVGSNGKWKGVQIKKKHLEWLLARGEDRAPKMLCPYCGEEPVEHFLAIYTFGGKYFTIKESFLFCKKDSCKKKASPEIDSRHEVVATLPVKFSSIDKFSSKRDRRKVISLLRKSFNLQGRPTTEDLFSFFSN